MEYGLIGEKLGHSYSALIHSELADYSYVLREIEPQALDAFMEARDFKGMNVTIPYKKAVIPHCSELSEAAREVGSVNTVLRRNDGTLFGHNTDIGGFISMLRSAGIDPNGKKCAVLGSGGTSLTARAALKRLGAREIIVVSRQGPVDYASLYSNHSDIGILINTTPVGMYPKTGVCPVELGRFPSLSGVADVIYNPEKTALILDAQERGIPAVSGLKMLVAQAHEAAMLFAGRTIPEDRIDAVCARISCRTLNLVLVGMPGCGKSRLGQLLAEKLGRPFWDCDAEIVRRAGISIPEIFDRYGEARFRELESEVIADLGSGSGAVIATGGGCILRPENVRSMRQNGRVCFVRRPLDALPRDGRPLSSSADAVAALWEERREKYLAAADFTVDNNGSAESAAERIEEEFYEAACH